MHRVVALVQDAVEGGLEAPKTADLVCAMKQRDHRHQHPAAVVVALGGTADRGATTLADGLYVEAGHVLTVTRTRSASAQQHRRTFSSSAGVPA